MPSATARPDLPEHWRRFLTDVSARLPEPVELHCSGGFVGMVVYGLPRGTEDLDYIEILPVAAAIVLQQIAGAGSELHKTHRHYFQHAGAVTSLPDGYVERLTEICPGQFPNLRLRALDPHDLALSKLTRDSPIDREDVEHLARSIPLNPDTLRGRFETEFSGIALGNIEEHRLTLERWIEWYCR